MFWISLSLISSKYAEINFLQINEKLGKFRVTL